MVLMLCVFGIGVGGYSAMFRRKNFGGSKSFGKSFSNLQGLKQRLQTQRGTAALQQQVLKEALLRRFRWMAWLGGLLVRRAFLHLDIG